MQLFNMFSQRGRSISPSEARRQIEKNPNIVVIDVRQPDEYRQMHIEGARLIPLDKLPVQAANSLPDKDAPILVYCHSGARAGNAVTLLSRMGYTDAVSFGGIIDWPYETVKGGEGYV